MADREEIERRTIGAAEAGLLVERRRRGRIMCRGVHRVNRPLIDRRSPSFGLRAF
jgi:hypothetical protein